MPQPINLQIQKAGQKWLRLTKLKLLYLLLLYLSLTNRHRLYGFHQMSLSQVWLSSWLLCCDRSVVLSSEGDVGDVYKTLRWSFWPDTLYWLFKSLMILITKYYAYAKVYQAVSRKPKFHWFVWPCGVLALLEAKVTPKMTSLDLFISGFTSLSTLYM